jgi:hypothetical protein
MRNYLKEVRSFYQFVAANFDYYKQKEIKAAERTKTLNFNKKLRTGKFQKKKTKQQKRGG